MQGFPSSTKGAPVPRAPIITFHGVSQHLEASPRPRNPCILCLCASKVAQLLHNILHEPRARTDYHQMRGVKSKASKTAVLVPEHASIVRLKGPSAASALPCRRVERLTQPFQTPDLWSSTPASCHYGQRGERLGCFSLGHSFHTS